MLRTKNELLNAAIIKKTLKNSLKLKLIHYTLKTYKILNKKNDNDNKTTVKNFIIKMNFLIILMQ